MIWQPQCLVAFHLMLDYLAILLMAKVMQMYLQDGNYANQQILKSKTINLFNYCYYCDEDNRRSWF